MCMVACVGVMYILIELLRIKCYQDISPGSGVAKLQRIRMYIMLESYAICGAVLANFIGYLVIDNVTQADSGKYECIADTKLTAADTKVSASLELHIGTSMQ